MENRYIFRQAAPQEIQAVFDLIMGRVAWMDTVGIRQWNTTKYDERYPLHYYEQRRQQNGAVNGLDAEFRSQQEERDDQQYDIDHQRDDGYRDRDEIAEDHGNCGGAAHGDMAGHHEEIHRGCNDDGTQSNDKKFL